jgi:FlaA1/EpsC-like NDP-sugar epimerase
MGVNLGTTLVFGQKVSKQHPASGWSMGQDAVRRRSASQSPATTLLMMLSDVIAVLVALYFALHFGLDRLFGQWISIEQAVSEGPSLRTQLGYLLGFISVLLIMNRSQGLYGGLQMQSILHEQRKTMQSCLATGLLLCGGLYMMHNTTISRAVVAYLVCLTTVLLCIVRGTWRYSIHRDYEKGLETKNVVILGASHVAEVMRKQIVKNRRLGREFKGFVTNHAAGLTIAPDAQYELVVGRLCELRHLVRRHFIDEIIIAESCSTPTVVSIVEMARELDVEVLVVPGFYEDVTPEAPIFYLGDFPVVSLHSREDKVFGRLFKRVVDFVLSLAILILLAPVFIVIALAVKLT